MERKTRITNMIVFFLLTTLPTACGAFASNLLWRAVSMDLLRLFEAPQWLYTMTCSLIPVISFVLSLLLFRIYLCFQQAAEPVRSCGLDFLLGFFPSWSIVSSLAMFWGTASYLNHLPQRTAEDVMSNIFTAYMRGAHLLLNAFVASVCIGIFVAFFLRACRTLLPYIIEAINLRSRKLVG